MKILSTTDLSEYGNDCFIHKSVSLIEAFGMYTVITAEKVTGWFDRKQIYTKAEVTCDLDRAIWMYKQSGGVYGGDGNEATL